MLHILLSRYHLRSHLLHDLFCQTAWKPRSFDCLSDMPSADTIDDLVAIGASKHRELHLLFVNLTRSEARLR